MESLIKTEIIVAALVLCWGLEYLLPRFQMNRMMMRHRGYNLCFSLCNGVMVYLLAYLGLSSYFAWAAMHTWSLKAWLPIAPLWQSAVILVLFDGWQYWWHRINHRWFFLWRFHQMHHADGAMNATTAFRFHPVEIFYSTIARLLIIPILGLTAKELIIYESILFPVIVLHHANIMLPKHLDQLLRVLIVTPNMHWVHHSKVRSLHDSNYASVLSLWDRIFNSYHPPLPSQTVDETGLSYWPTKSWLSFKKSLQKPFLL